MVLFLCPPFSLSLAMPLILVCISRLLASWMVVHLARNHCSSQQCLSDHSHLRAPQLLSFILLSLDLCGPEAEGSTVGSAKCQVWQFSVRSPFCCLLPLRGESPHIGCIFVFTLCLMHSWVVPKRFPACFSIP